MLDDFLNVVVLLPDVQEVDCVHFLSLETELDLGSVGHAEDARVVSEGVVVALCFEVLAHFVVVEELLHKS